MTTPCVSQLLVSRGRADEPALAVRRKGGRGVPVLYVHGATFPSGLSVAYQFAGRSWMDDLADRGFDAWAFDFAGYGDSERPREMDERRDAPPIGRMVDAAGQILRVVDLITTTTGHSRVAIIAHSWGSLPAGLFTTLHPDRVARLCLFAPIAPRNLPDLPRPDTVGAWRLLSVADQLERFVEDVPLGHAAVLIEPTLARWGPAWLATDSLARTRSPEAVKLPAGPVADLIAAWSGTETFSPEAVKCPVLVVRGEWDRVTTAEDMAWFTSRLRHSQGAGITIEKATHLMHLEHGREYLFREAGSFLSGPAA